MGRNGDERNTPAFGIEIFLKTYFWRRFVSPTRSDCGVIIAGFLFSFGSQTTAFRLSPTFFFPVFGAAVLTVGSLPGGNFFGFPSVQAAILTAEDLSRMIGRKKPIAGLEQATALR